MKAWTINDQLVLTENDNGLSIRHICKVLPVETYGQQFIIINFLGNLEIY